MYNFYKSQLAAKIKDYSKHVIASIATHLAWMETPNYMLVKRTGVDKRMAHDIQNIFERCAHDIEHMWEDMRQSFYLHGALTGAFISRKAQPPWIPVKVNLNLATDGDSGLWRGQIHFHFQNLANEVIRRISQGLVVEENTHQILQRARKVLGLGKRRSIEGLWKQPTLNKIETDYDTTDIPAWQETTRIFDAPPVDITEGTFTLEDVEALRQVQVKANQWQYRKYSPDMDEMEWGRNKMMSALERSFMSDTVERLHAGVQTTAEENMGIDDMVWIVSKPQKECDACTDRDQMTMTEIKQEFGSGAFPKGEVWPPDLRQDSPPPLHPNCYCKLIPQIKGEWADKVGKKYGWDWNSDEGLAFNPQAEQKAMGFAKMSWDEWMRKVGGVSEETASR